MLFCGRNVACAIVVAAICSAVSHSQEVTGFTPQSSLRSAGGVAQYGIKLQNATSEKAALEALSDWNSYIKGRSNWMISAAMLSRLATADWNARSGPPTITADKLANASNHLIRNQLASMTLAQQQTLFLRMFKTSTPKGNLGLNPKYKYATSSQNPDGTFSVTIEPDAFSDMKSDMRSMVREMLSASANFYPGEAMMVAYSVATWDMGYGDTYVTRVKQRLADVTGLDMGDKLLYGEEGYLIRRPITTFLTDTAMHQFFADLGF
jgi:hypothetical protein